MNFSIAVSLSGLILFAAFTMSAYYTGISRIEEIFPDVTAPGSLGIIAYFSGILIPLIAYLYMKSVGKNREVSWMSAMGYFLWVLFMTSWFTFAHVGANSAVGPQNF